VKIPNRRIFAEESLMNRRALAVLSLGHFLIDLCQGIVPALMPFLVTERHFSYAKGAGLVFAISVTSSIVQPLFGQLADRIALSWLLPASVILAGTSLFLGAQAASYAVVVAALGLSGLGVAAFHPEAARKAHLASGDRRSTGMSYFAVGGGLGFALAPVVTSALVVAWGTSGLLALLVPTSIVAALLAGSIGSAAAPSHPSGGAGLNLPGDDNWKAFGILSCATICRSIVFYGLNSFLALYFMTRWDPNPAAGNRAPAIFLGTGLIGTLSGGWLADRFGRRRVIRVAFAGASVFMALLVIASNQLTAHLLLVPLAIFVFLPTSVLVVLGQEYLPKRVGMASGVTLGLAVSVGGVCAPLLGRLADRHGLSSVLFVLLALLAMATVQTLALPPAGRRSPRDTVAPPSPVLADQLSSP
jgi:MFS transporter, FSR family, fosmidomycin resistance protein